ncbi:MAG TPA: SDR family NAD(P)-dependent oxidoreductase [Conexibacter sp.]|nr:SDR family NAD(P)-dependent oxidoreductase [Conexibacter sp.]
MASTFSLPVDLSPLRDRIALVTGGASGLGRATALALAAAGAEVVVADVDAERGEQVAEQIGGHFVATDTSDLDANRAMVAFVRERCGRLDLVHLNAGVTTGCGVGEDFDLTSYRRAMGVNLDGVVFGAHAALSALRANDGPNRGAIVATASLAGLTGVPIDPLYATNKHAVVGLVRSLGPAFAPEGIRVNAVCPGFAKSAMTDPFAADLEAAGVPLIPAEVVAETVVRVLALDVAGECWFVQPGREPAPFAFRNIPGPRAAVSSEEERA